MRGNYSVCNFREVKCKQAPHSVMRNRGRKKKDKVIKAYSKALIDNALLVNIDLQIRLKRFELRGQNSTAASQINFISNLKS